MSMRIENPPAPKTPDQTKPRVLFVKKEFFPSIRKGLQTIEIRPVYAGFRLPHIGEILTFKTSPTSRAVKVRVVGVRQHLTLATVLEKEKLDKIFPGIEASQAALTAQNIFNDENIKKNGLIAIEFEKI